MHELTLGPPIIKFYTTHDTNMKYRGREFLVPIENLTRIMVNNVDVLSFAKEHEIEIVIRQNEFHPFEPRFSSTLKFKTNEALILFRLTYV